MPLIIPGNVATATADVTYSVANSCRFDRASDASMTLSMSSGGSTTKFTKSFWVKRCAFGEQHYLFDNSGVAQTFIRFTDDDRFAYAIYHTTGGYSTDLATTARFRDPSAWYHFVVAVDYTSGTQAHRARLYCNGTEITDWGTETRPSNDSTTFDTWNSSKTHYIGNTSSGSHDAHVYLAEVVHIDGLALTPSSFGEFNSDSPTIWQPIDVSGLTFGTKGHYLDFEDSDNLGDDESGNTADWTEVNLAAIDQCVDSPTNNFATYNPLFVGDPNLTYAEGNLKLTSGSEGQKNAVSTIAVTSGKWYAEFKSETGTNYPGFGIMDTGSVLQTTVAFLGSTTDSYCMFQDGNYYTNHSADDTGITWGEDVIMGVGIDLDSATKTIKFYKDGSEEHSATIATPANAYVFATSHHTNGTISETNFGNPSVALSSAVADANGYGNFEFAPPSGYFALCTKNLAEYG